MNNQMHTHTDSALSPASSATGSASVRYRGSEQASDLLKRLFRRYPGSLSLKLWNGTVLRVGTNAAGGADSPFTLVFRSPEVVWSAVLGRDPLTLADAYFRGDLDIEGDFFAALSIKDHLDALQMPVGERLLAAFTALRLRMLNAAAQHSENLFAPANAPRIKAHSKAENRDAIHFHYDVSNEFYSL
ncbi:MAG: cyclopropane-fatty-acyl-phospholipid synthase, partial [Gammaproteobacteria bacterium]|nr:cyclopropane-fatty-acyl-phospholipid synthase [Gammaproteobacteria bacterium]